MLELGTYKMPIFSKKGPKNRQFYGPLLEAMFVLPWPLKYSPIWSHWQSQIMIKLTTLKGFCFLINSFGPFFGPKKRNFKVNFSPIFFFPNFQNKKFLNLIKLLLHLETASSHKRQNGSSWQRKLKTKNSGISKF